MTPQNRNLPNNAAATSVPDKNLAGLEVYGNQEEKTWEEEPGRKNVGGLEVYWNQEETGPRENISIVWEDWKFMEIKRKLVQEKILVWKDRLSDLQKGKVKVKVEVILHICFTYLFCILVFHSYFTYSFQIFLSHICFVSASSPLLI